MSLLSRGARGALSFPLSLSWYCGCLDRPRFSLMRSVFIEQAARMMRHLNQTFTPQFKIRCYCQYTKFGKRRVQATESRISPPHHPRSLAALQPLVGLIDGLACTAILRGPHPPSQLRCLPLGVFWAEALLALPLSRASFHSIYSQYMYTPFPHQQGTVQI